MLSERDLTDLVSSITTDLPFVQRDGAASTGEGYRYMRDLLHRRREVVIPGITARIQHRTPTLNRDAHDYQNRMLAATLKVRVAATSDKTRAVEGAAAQEKFFYRYFYRWRDARVFDRPLFDMASIGKGGLHLRINPAALPDVPSHQKSATPLTDWTDLAEKSLKDFIAEGKGDVFVLEAVDPATLYWTPEKDIRFQAAVLPLRKVAQEYANRGVGIEPDEKEGFKLVSLSPGHNIRENWPLWSHRVTLYTVEDKDYCYHLLSSSIGATSQTKTQSRLLATYKNYLGRPGFFHIDGELTGDTHPLYESNPLIYGKYALAPQENLLYTIMLNAGLDAGQQRWALKWTGEGSEPSEPANLKITIGADGVLQHPPGYEIYAPQLAVGMDLTKAIELVNQQSERYGFPKSLGRPDEVSATSGYDRALHMEALGNQLDPPLTHWANTVVEIFQAMSYAICEIGIEQSVRNTYTAAGQITVAETVTIKPDDMADVDISGSFDSMTLSSRIALMEEYLKLMEADQEHETGFQTSVMGTDDMEGFRDQRALDKVLKHADDLAVAAVNALADKVKGQLEQKAFDNAGIVPPQQVPPEMTDPSQMQPEMPGQMVATNGQTLRADRGPAIPSGPGSAMPVTPTAPGMGA